MFLPVEKMEDFLEILEAVAEDDKDSVPVFVRENKTINEKGLLSGEVVVQCQYDTNMIAMYSHTDGIVPVQIPRNDFFLSLQQFADEDIIKKIRDGLKVKTDILDNQLKTEAEKVLKVLDGRGFKGVVSAIWTL